MKSVDPGILNKSCCFTFQPNAFQKTHLKYMTWLGHYYCTSRYYMDRETYPYALLIFVREGKMHIQYEGHTWTIGKGDVLLIDCLHPHRYQADDGLEFLYMHFDGPGTHALTNYLIKQNGGPVFRKGTNIAVGHLLYACVTTLVKGHSYHMIEEESQILRMLAKIAGDSPDFSEPSPIETAISFMGMHLHCALEIPTIAASVNLSPSHFAHLFKRQTGFAPLSYLRKLRLEKAMVLLVHSQKTIAEIALSVGYASSPSFINTFLRELGTSPKNYRQMERGKRLKKE